jgi:predicted nucleotidyltransferase component of viral defense system
MPASAATLHHLARETGFRAETLEKVVRLGDLARDFTAQPLLERSLALKGGTAINLALGPPARLSVDLDFNFVGSLAREEMLAQRPEIEALVERIARGQGYQVQWSGPAHAARNAHLAYPSVLGGNDAIKVDINYQHRQPLGDTTIRELWMPGEIAGRRSASSPNARSSQASWWRRWIALTRGTCSTHVGCRRSPARH